MREVLISIQPKWCELIALGKKTVEVRKTKPKIDTPFKCYIYCTSVDSMNLNEYVKIFQATVGKIDDWHGKVIGEFVCDRICPIFYTLDGLADVVDCNTTCLNPKDFIEYGKGKTLYGWHISDLVIYEKAKDLSEFCMYCGDNPKCDGCEAHYYSSTECGTEDYCCSIIDGHRPLKRPPQSWCYAKGW